MADTESEIPAQKAVRFACVWVSRENRARNQQQQKLLIKKLFLKIPFVL